MFCRLHVCDTNIIVAHLEVFCKNYLTKFIITPHIDLQCLRKLSHKSLRHEATDRQRLIKKLSLAFSVFLFRLQLAVWISTNDTNDQNISFPISLIWTWRFHYKWWMFWREKKTISMRTLTVAIFHRIFDDNSPFASELQNTYVTCYYLHQCSHIAFRNTLQG